MAATGWDDELFDNVIDPFQDIAIMERQAGRVAGSRAGYVEGHGIGRSKGWEIGLELGYIISFARAILDGYHQHQNDNVSETESRSHHRLDRCLVLARELIKMVHEFPDPDSLLQNNDSDVMQQLEAATGEGKDANHNNSETDTVASKTSDVSSSIQRIRAKFKLFCVLLKTQQPFDLKRVLEVKESIGTDKAGLQTNTTSEGGKLSSSKKELSTNSQQKESDW